MALASPIQETATAAAGINLYTPATTTTTTTTDCNGNDVTEVANNNGCTLSQLIPDKQAKLTADMARDLITVHAKRSGSRASNKYVETMRRVVNELLVRHEIVFNSMMRQLSLTHDNVDELSDTFQKVCDEMLADNACNWGRVASVFAFAAVMAKHVVDTGISNGVRYEDVIGEALTYYVNTKLGLWIYKAGGWVSDG